jgi:hypothetical protein
VRIAVQVTGEAGFFISGAVSTFPPGAFCLFLFDDAPSKTAMRFNK